ncbi:MAG: GNAT family N-acetyltransferase [Acidobacteriota bacterium]
MTPASSPTETSIVTMDRRHAPAIARLHQLGLPRGFLSTLGDSFLEELYQAIARAPESVVWVAESPTGRCVGFIAGTTNVGRCYRAVLCKAWFRLGARLVTRVWRPIVLRRTAQTLLYPLRRRAEGHRRSGAVNAIQAELLSVAVAEEAHGTGVGKALVTALEKAFRSWGHEGEYRVVTDAGDPRSNAFYRALGFVHRLDFTHHEHLMSCYTKICNWRPEDMS